MSVRILTGDCRDVLKTLPDNSVDSIVTDPPYGLEFMGKDWDSFGGDNRQPFRGEIQTPNNPFGRSTVRYGGTASLVGGKHLSAMHAFQSWCEEWARECLRVLKPGGHMVAFGGTRTYHRMVCAVEDAGFEIRDQLAWTFGSGFPKSKNLDGDWEGWGTALKPAWEPIVLARKPLIGTVAANLEAHGVGALNIDACRIETDDPLGGGAYVHNGKRSVSNHLNSGGMNRPGATAGKDFQQPLGRWPANLAHDGSDEVLAAFPNAPGQIADASSSSSSRKPQNVYGAMKRGNGRDGEPSADSENGGDVGFKMRPGARRGDAGSAARFFYCAKASAEDRHIGRLLEAKGNKHPTVKPTALMRWLVRMVTPPGGTVLDPFLGSGSTLRAADIEGFDGIGIEKDAGYVEIARERIRGDAPLFAETAA